MQSCSVVEACTGMLIPVCRGSRRVDLPPQLHHALLVSWCGLYPSLLPFLPLPHIPPLHLSSLTSNTQRPPPPSSPRRRRLAASPSSPRRRRRRRNAIVASLSLHSRRRIAVVASRRRLASLSSHRRRRAAPRPVAPHRCLLVSVAAGRLPILVASCRRFSIARRRSLPVAAPLLLRISLGATSLPRLQSPPSCCVVATAALRGRAQQDKGGGGRRQRARATGQWRRRRRARMTTSR